MNGEVQKAIVLRMVYLASGLYILPTSKPIKIAHNEGTIKLVKYPKNVIGNLHSIACLLLYNCMRVWF